MSVRRPRRLVRRFALLAIVLGLIAAGVWAIADVDRYKSAIEATASAAIGAPVVIDGSAAASFAPLGVQLTHVRIGAPDQPLVTAERVLVRMRLASLLRRKVEISALTARGIVLRVSSQAAALLSAVSVRDGIARTPSRRLVSVGLAPAVHLEAEGTIEMPATGAIEGASLVATIQPHAGESAALLQGRFQARRARLQLIETAEIGGEIVVGRGTVTLSPLAFQAYGGRATGECHIGLPAEGPTIACRHLIDGVRLEEVVPRPERRPGLTGPVSIATDVTIRPRQGIDAVRSISGRVTMTGSGLTLTGQDIDAMLDRYDAVRSLNLYQIGSTLITGPLRGLFTRDTPPAVDAGGQTPLRRLVSSWRLGDGRAEALDVAFATPRNRVAARGTLDLAAQQFLGVIVAVVDPEGCVRYSQTLTGSFGAPITNAPRVGVGVLTGPVVGLLRGAGASVGPGCPVFYAGIVQ